MLTSDDVANDVNEIIEDVDESATGGDIHAEPESPDEPSDVESDEDFSAEDSTENPTDESAEDFHDETEPLPHKSAEQSQEEEISAVVEAILFASDSPISQAKIGMIAELPGRSIKKAIEQLNERYEKLGAAFRIQEIAGGWQMLTLSQYNDVLKRMLNVKKDSRLTQPTMETLAIVAYRQPILRADVEAIRGVASGEVLRGLLEKGLVKIVGRAEVIGRPILYGTTKRFLETFGLGSLDDLPRSEDLRQPSEQPAPKTSTETDNDEDASVISGDIPDALQPQEDNEKSDGEEFADEADQLDEEDFDDEDFDEDDDEDDDDYN